MKMIRNLALISAACLTLTGTAAVFPVLPVLAAEESAQKENACGEQVVWTFEEGTLTVSGRGDMYDYTLPPFFTSQAAEEQADPDSIPRLTGRNEVSLAELPWGGFKNDIRRIVIEDGVTGIGMNAFANCTAAESVTIADSVTKINERAFEGCESLQSLTLPNNLKIIGEMAFTRCGRKGDGIRRIDIPDGTESVGQGAFSYCKNLSAVTLPDSIQNVETRAFEGTGWLESFPETEPFIIENGVLLGYHGRFEDELVIPDGVRVIGGGALEYAAYHSNGKNPVLKITVPDSVMAICEFAFCWCGEMQEIVIPASVKTIHNSAFFNCFDLKKITLPESIRTIGAYAFGNCQNLTEVTLPKSVTELGADAFERCDTLKTVTILNPDMKIDGEDGTFTNSDEPVFHEFSGVIRGYQGSTAETYAKQYSRNFEAIPQTAGAVTAGDVNGDSRIDVSDAVLLARFLTADAEAAVTDAGIQNADVNRDGKRDSDDLTLLLCALAKKVKISDL